MSIMKELRKDKEIELKIKLSKMLIDTKNNLIDSFHKELSGQDEQIIQEAIDIVNEDYETKRLALPNLIKNILDEAEKKAEQDISKLS